MAINTTDAKPIYVRMWFHRCHFFWYIGHISLESDTSARANRLFSGTLNSTVIPKGPIKYASEPTSRNKPPGSLIFSPELTAITEHKTGVPRKNTRNIGLIIVSFIRCIANMPLSEGRSANAIMTKLENAKSSPVTKPAPDIEATIMIVINSLMLFRYTPVQIYGIVRGQTLYFTYRL